MNLFRIAIVSLLLSTVAHAQVPRQPLPAVTPALRSEPNVIVAPPVVNRGAAAPASPGRISERPRAGAEVGLPAVQRPEQVVNSGAILMTPLDDATQRESRQAQSISDLQKQKQDAANSAIQNMK